MKNQTCSRAGWRAVAVAVVALLAAHSALALQAIPATDKIKLDGKLDEADWQRAPVSANFIENMPREKQPARDRTEVRMLFDHDALYVGVRAFDPEPARIYAPFVRRDKVFGNQDNLIIWIDPTGARKFAQFFRVNPRGVLADGVWNEDNTEEDFSPDFDFEAVPARLADGWSAEFLLPWTVASMKGSDAPRRTVAIMFDRVLGHTRERAGFPAASFMRPRYVSEFHKVEIDQYQASVFHVFPYATAAYDFKGDARDGKAGADLYWKPSGDLQLTAALNPDFGQVEADELVVNFDAIETFFSDRRPFFTENQGLFDVRTPDSGLLIYTRRIGGPRDDDPGRAAEIDLALKLNGSVLGLDYGVLAAQEAEQEHPRRLSR
jgi:hypothetical protein